MLSISTTCIRQRSPHVCFESIMNNHERKARHDHPLNYPELCSWNRVWVRWMAQIKLVWGLHTLQRPLRRLFTTNYDIGATP